tara:strand:+ start:252 stop:497 length:246 start_codon:yes stop_codon:yes gene_type:complete
MVKESKDMDVLEKVMENTWLVNAECHIEPIMEKDYYLYKRSEGTSFISLVEPEYWDTTRFTCKYVATVRKQPSGEWMIRET